MYVLKFNDHTNRTTTRKFFKSFDDAHAEMTSQWEDRANEDYLEDLEEERDAETWRCYREECDGEAYAVLEHLDSDHGPDYEWTVAKAKNYYVNISTVLSTDRVIAAESEEEAVQIARDLCFDYLAEDVIDSFNNDYEAYRVKNWEFEGCGEAGEDMDAENKE